MRGTAIGLATALILGIPGGAWAADDAAPQAWAVHGQSTFVEQANAAFTAPYTGPNSLNPHAVGKETWDVTLYAGIRPWRGAEVWINPEIDQGFGPVTPPTTATGGRCRCSARACTGSSDGPR